MALYSRVEIQLNCSLLESLLLHELEEQNLPSQHYRFAHLWSPSSYSMFPDLPLREDAVTEFTRAKGLDL